MGEQQRIIDETDSRAVDTKGSSVTFDQTTPFRGGLAAAWIAVIFAGCTPAQPATVTTAQPAQVSVVTVHRSSVPITIELPGRTSPYLVAQVRARVDGIVLKREFKEGGDVKAGERLYQIDPAPYVAALNSATA